MILYFAGLIVPILSFILQSYSRIFNKYFGVDVWTRLIEIDLVRRNRHKIPKDVKSGFIIEGEFDYPPFFPLIMSFISKKRLGEIQGFVAPFFDSLQCLLVFLICIQLTGNILVAMCAQLIYMTIPLIALENSYLTARSLGYLNFTLALYPLILYSFSHDALYILVGYIFTSLIFLTHRFAAQSLFFAVIFFSVVDRTFLYLGVFIAGFVTAIIVTRGYYLRVLQGHWLNIYFWFINYKDRFVHQVTRLPLAGGRRDFIGKIYHILGSFSPFALFGLNSWLLPAFVYLFIYVMNPGILLFRNELFLKLGLWVLFFYVAAIIILSVKRMLCVGEGQRYLEMATVPTSILSSIILFSFISTNYKVPAILLFAALFFGNIMLIILVQIKLIIKDRTRSKTDDMQKVYSYINKLKKKPRIMCIPHQLTTMTLYNSRSEVLVNANNLGLMGNMMDFYPVLKKPIKKIAQEFKLDYLLLRESYAKLSELKLKKENVVYKSGDVALVKL